jgi:methyl-accepting chemotaxis protein
MTSELALTIIAVCQALGLLLLAALAFAALGPLRKLGDGLGPAMSALQAALTKLDGLLAELKDNRVVSKAASTLDSLSGGAGQLEPLAQNVKTTLEGVQATLTGVQGTLSEAKLMLGEQLTATLVEARGLMDDATQTSQAVRTRVEDLAATQHELNAMAKALADVAYDLRDKELASKLTNLLSDTSVLAADIGMLAQNANSLVEQGRPLISNVSDVVSDAQQKVHGISAAIGAIKDGLASTRK